MSKSITLNMGYIRMFSVIVVVLHWLLINVVHVFLFLSHIFCYLTHNLGVCIAFQAENN